MKIETQREALRSLYPENQAWLAKVDGMTNSEVKTLYLRFKAQNKL